MLEAPHPACYRQVRATKNEGKLACMRTGHVAHLCQHEMETTRCAQIGDWIGQREASAKWTMDYCNIQLLVQCRVARRRHTKTGRQCTLMLRIEFAHVRKARKRRCSESDRKKDSRRRCTSQRLLMDAGQLTGCMQVEAEPNRLRGTSREIQHPSSGKLKRKRSVPGESPNGKRVQQSVPDEGGPTTILEQRGIISKIFNHHHPGAGSNPHVRTEAWQHGHGNHGVNSSPHR